MFPPFRPLAEMISAAGVDRVPRTSLYRGRRLSEDLAAGRIVILSLHRQSALKDRSLAAMEALSVVVFLPR